MFNDMKDDNQTMDRQIPVSVQRKRKLKKAGMWTGGFLAVLAGNTAVLMILQSVRFHKLVSLVMIPLVSVLYTLGREFTDYRLNQLNIPPEKLEPKPIVKPKKVNQAKERKKQKKMERMKQEFLKAQELLKKKD